jgi:hypothetical protein
MFDRQVRLEVERAGKRASVRERVSGNDVAGVVGAFKGEPDVTLIISQEDTDETLLIAVSGGRAFVALDKGPDGLFQFVVSGKHAAGKQRLVIAGQETDIDSAYVLCVADEWPKGGWPIIIGRLGTQMTTNLQ